MVEEAFGGEPLAWRVGTSAAALALALQLALALALALDSLE